MRQSQRADPRVGALLSGIRNPGCRCSELSLPHHVVGEHRVSVVRAVLSPCTGVCQLGSEGLCLGCLRTGDEIARWLQMGDDERLRVMEEVLPLREAARG